MLVDDLRALVALEMQRRGMLDTNTDTSTASTTASSSAAADALTPAAKGAAKAVDPAMWQRVRLSERVQPNAYSAYSNSYYNSSPSSKFEQQMKVWIGSRSLRAQHPACSSLGAGATGGGYPIYSGRPATVHVNAQ